MQEKLKRWMRFYFNAFMTKAKKGTCFIRKPNVTTTFRGSVLISLNAKISFIDEKNVQSAEYNRGY